MEIFYHQPAKAWEEALPAGNGTLGCMLFGGIEQEHLQLNEDSVWSGGPRDRINPDSAKALPEIRRLLRAGKIPEAEELALCALSGTPYSQRTYQTLGDLYMDFPELDPLQVNHYRRSLDLDHGILQVKFSIGDTWYTRKIFASYPDQVLVIQLQAEGREKLRFRCRMDRNRALDQSGHLGNDSIFFTGHNGEDGIAFSCMLRCIDTDGAAQVLGDFLLIENAEYATLCLCASTSFRAEHPIDECTIKLKKAGELGREKLLSRHSADFFEHMKTTRLELGEREKDEIPTDKRLFDYQNGTIDPGLEALYFQYGRYLLLSSSRPGSLPANLQGLWNSEYYPPWDSKYTININTEMNYWPAEICGLSECHLPLFDLLNRMKITGKETAMRMYGCRGFTAHHNTDIWADTAPQDQYIPASYWPMGAAWLCTHIWRHYQYTLDTKFLSEEFDTLQECVLFFEDYLEKNSDGYFVTNPSVSPENTYILPNGASGCICIGSTMDEQILRELFSNFLFAAQTLSINNEIVEKAKIILPHLRPTQIGSDGRLLEWEGEYGEAEPGHRHISHLYGLAPGKEICPDHTPDKALAAKRTLEYRLSHGGGHTGWSRAWITLLWARLQEGGAAYENLHTLLARSTFPNLMDNHPLKNGYVFQIDGNLGAITAIAEFFVQAKDGFIRLTPALPPCWETGRITGIALPGAARIDLEWKEGNLKKAIICSDYFWKNTIRYRDVTYSVSLNPGEPYIIIV